jgi:predicted amidohydrolase
MKIAAIQHDICWEDPAATFEHLRPFVGTAVAAGARLAVVTEMFATGFSMAAERVAEPPDGPSTMFLRDQARAHGIWLAGSIPTRDAALDRPVNRLVLAAPDGTMQRYDKIHPFSYGGEHEVYGAGTRFLTVDVEGTRCSFFVCYDLRFADEFWAVAPGTDCYVVPANWPAARRHAWRTLLPARAVENQAYVVGVNRVGADGNGVAHAGDSMIVDPLGATLASASHTETVLVADVDPGNVAAVRDRFPFLQDRRSATGSAAAAD